LIAAGVKEHATHPRVTCLVMKNDRHLRRQRVHNRIVEPDLKGYEMTAKKVVEVVVPQEGKHVPLGLMNAQQALDLPADMDVRISHPDRPAGATDLFMDRAELRDHLEAEGDFA
jgi:hypothetical protein